MKGIVLSVFAALLVAMVSCSGGSGEGTGPAGKLYGKWFYSGKAGNEDSMDIHMLIVFNADLTMETYLLTGETSSEYFMKCSSIFSVSGNKLMTKAADCEGGGRIKDSEMTFNLSGDSLTLVGDDTVTFSRWNGDTSSLSLIKQQVPQGPAERLAPQISINSYPVPSTFLFIKM